MIVRVLKGLLSGGILAVSGLVAVSQFAPLPERAGQAPAPEAAAEPTKAAPESAAVVDPAPADPAPADPAPADPAADGAATEAEAVAEPDGAAEAEVAVEAPAAPDPLLDPPASAEAPAAEPPAAEAPAEKAPEPALPQTDTAPETGFDETVPNVTTDRLPAITLPEGGAPAPQDPAPEGQLATEAAPAPDMPGTPVETITAAPTRIDPTVGPLVNFARPFENTDQKPLFALVLVDTGEPGLDRANMAALPFPITFVIDPMAQGAADAAAIYRQAGQEVVMRATGIPAGATATDVEQSLQAMGQMLPEAVAYLDLDQGGFQDDRSLASAVVPAIGAQGRGVITFDRGLDSAQQVATREKVPAAQVFRILDGADETQSVIRRYLDRAAFKAAQEGGVVVLGKTRQDTLATILQWTVEGRADSVALAPISAILNASTAP